MIDYKLKFKCSLCDKDFIHHLANRGFKVYNDGDVYIVVDESEKHTVCPFCDALQFQKQWRSGLGRCIDIMVPKLNAG